MPVPSSRARRWSRIPRVICGWEPAHAASRSSPAGGDGGAAFPRCGQPPARAIVSVKPAIDHTPGRADHPVRDAVEALRLGASCRA